MQAQIREQGSKGSARRMRLEGIIPGVIYGSNKDPKSITIPLHDLTMALKKGGFFTNPLEIEIDGKKEKVLPRDIQREPVQDKIQHIDFLRFDAKRKLKSMVAIRITGEEECPGAQTGGIVSLMRAEVELICRADSIPDFLEISVAGLEIGGVAKFSSIELPDGVEPTISDRDFTVASILAIRTIKEDEEMEAEAAEAAAAAAEGEEGSEETETAEGSEGDKDASEDKAEEAKSE